MHEKRLDKTAEEASMAFWSSVADQFPEIKTGDLPPDAAEHFRHAAKRVIESWLEVNAPTDNRGTTKRG